MQKVSNFSNSIRVSTDKITPAAKTSDALDIPQEQVDQICLHLPSDQSARFLSFIKGEVKTVDSNDIKIWGKACVELWFADTLAKIVKQAIKLSGNDRFTLDLSYCGLDQIEHVRTIA